MEISLRHLLQQDVMNMRRLSALEITIIGAGSIGSTTSVFLGKMGTCGLTIYDEEHVESHNWSSHLFRDEDIGKLKASA